MSQDDYKKAAALAAIEHVEAGMVVGIGTGSTANHFIEALAAKVFSLEAQLRQQHR